MRLHAYVDRIGAGRAPLGASIEGLRALHAAHRETFLFENLSIQTGGDVSVAVDAIERKFLDEGRGGYCFEHNTLFAAALADLGWVPVTLLGRVRRGPPERWCRTHMVLKVSPARGASPDRSQAWLCDVGFGAIGLVEPMPLRDGVASLQGGLLYTLRREGGLWVLSVRDASGLTTDLYEFSEDPQTMGDVIMANHYTATHPDSIFRRALTLQRTRMADRIALSSLSLTRHVDGRLTTTPIDRARLADLARELVGIELPAGPFVFESYVPASVQG